jgi:beta-glucanase (GH16 family)
MNTDASPKKHERPRGIRLRSHPLLIVLLTAVAVAPTAWGRPAHGSGAPPGNSAFQKLVFNDDFDDLDTNRWQHEITAGGGGNWEFQWYTNNRSNSFVEDGILYIKPTLTTETIGAENLAGGDYRLDLWGSQPADSCTGNAFYGCLRIAGAGGNIINPIQSARLRTAQSFSFKYGHVKIRARLPRGDWIWPALWMLPRYNAYGNWPASGEIDIMEARGNAEGYPMGGIDSIGSTAHVGPYWAADNWQDQHGTLKSKSSRTFADDFHVFGLVWTKDAIYTYVDDESNKVMHVKFDRSFWDKNGWEKNKYNNPWRGRPNNAPFDQEFYLIMNVAVGGTGPYFPDNVAGKPWTNSDQHAINSFWQGRQKWLPTWKGNNCAMAIDYVRVYQ